MTDFRYHSKPPAFKLGILERTDTGLRQFSVRTMPPEEMINKPIITPKLPEPNIYFTPIQDNRDIVLERMKREMEYQLNITKNALPSRY